MTSAPATSSRRSVDRLPVLLACLAAALTSACSTLYYETQEFFGNEKRDILSDKVADGRDDQLEAKEQFQTTLAAFKAATGFDGGDLESTYDLLNGELEDCESQAGDVRDRIEAIEDVAVDFFAEWEAEIELYNDADLRSRSRGLMSDSRRNYTTLITAMRKAESKMEPVLVVFRDQVRFLKHNLNAQAIASLQSNVVQIEGDVERLVADMEASIEEANAFIATLG